jgi:putative ABC transport system substrate-binding protein
MVKERADGVILTRNPVTASHRKQISELAVKSRLPAMCEGSDFADDGCLISYARDRREGWRQAAVYVDKILKGAKPADLPVQRPTRFELVINLKTAKQIGVTIPQWVLVKADRVIR